MTKKDEQNQPPRVTDIAPWKKLGVAALQVCADIRDTQRRLQAELDRQSKTGKQEMKKRGDQRG
jgi:hypothetical protein